MPSRDCLGRDQFDSIHGHREDALGMHEEGNRCKENKCEWTLITIEHVLVRTEQPSNFDIFQWTIFS